MSRELLDLARTVGREAAELVRTRRPRGRVGVAATKSTPTDVVTEIDEASERLIRARILQFRPEDGFLGEEGEEIIGSSGVRWIVDPIDGTVNFVYGIPAYAVSIAASIDGEVALGYVVNIATGEEYAALAGHGAWHWEGDEQTVLHGPPPATLDQMLVATGFNYAADVREQQARAVLRLLPQVRDIRRIGAASLDLVALAEGRIDAYVEQGLKPWDLAAGGLIAREAGLVLSGLDGPPGERLVVAAHPVVFEEYLDLVRACGF
ncbi:inositol monophosphatase family protein [uncultured Aeromicrobium sp.]|uniref:inositol monophosphatase family protein n=1 Tax=uncultured Aeromicrobium sp. TaxID=337820 RepID=UPI0025FEC746|nr:inositol monophosphatase family protein [uncultured Aeromicrobium sp.]